MDRHKGWSEMEKQLRFCIDEKYNLQEICQKASVKIKIKGRFLVRIKKNVEGKKKQENYIISVI